MNDEQQYHVSFAIHAGDIKNGGTPCGEISFKRFERLINALDYPSLYTIGDNGWTDCHRYSNGNWDPLERLALQRERFFDPSGKTKLGGGTPLKTITGGSKYPENQMIEANDVLFVTLGVPGSNNNFYDNVDQDCPATLDVIDKDCQAANAEYAARDAAVVAFMAQAFQKASSKGLKGIMFVIQANIFKNCKSKTPPLCSGNVTVPDAEIYTGFQNFWESLIAHTLDFPGKVALVHGDHHVYQLFYPKPEGYEDIANLVALQVPGSSNIGWVHTIVDPTTTDVFSFENIGISY